MMLTGFSMHQRGIGAAISRRTKSSAVERFGLFALLAMEVARTTDGKVGAWRVSNHQIPAAVEQLLDGLLQMPARVGLTLEQITAPCVMTAAPEGIAHAAAVFAGD
jgi:hypothetical protein